MQYTVTRGEKGKIEVRVDVPKAAFDEAYSDVVKKLGTDVKVDGFRPGQVPVEVLEQKIGANKILNETASFLIAKHLGDIFEKEQVVPIANPKIAVDSLSKGTTFSFLATLWDKPKVKVGDWKKLKVKKIAAKEVTDKDVEESIKNIFEAWQKQKAAKVTEGTEETEETEETKESGKFIYDAHGDKIPLKEDKVLEASSDEMNDEFAKAIGARDMAHLKELVQKDLETIVADNVEQKVEEEIFDELTGLGTVDVPDILVDDELNRILVRLNSQLDQQGKTLEDFLKEESLTLEALKEKWKPQAEKNVKVTLIMDEIGKEEKVHITREEIDEAMKGVNRQNIDVSQKADLERYLAVSIFQAKTLDLVKKTIAVA